MILLGWILVPLAAACGAYEAYMAPHWYEGTRKQYRFTWKFMYPWDNKEDGIADTTYKQFDSMFMKIVYWSAFRNPANNLRYVPGLSVKIKQEKVKYIGSKVEAVTDYDRNDKTFWYICWNGFYSNFRSHFKMFGGTWRFWLGWKVYPEDSKFEVTGHRKESAGFATQFKRIG